MYSSEQAILYDHRSDRQYCPYSRNDSHSQWFVSFTFCSISRIIKPLPCADVCAYTYKFETWGGLLVIFLSSLILSLRVFSICEKSYKVAAV